MAKDAHLLNQHVVEGVGDAVQDANQLEQNLPPRHRLQRAQLTPPPVTEPAFLTSLLSLLVSLALKLRPQHEAA